MKTLGNIMCNIMGGGLVILMLTSPFIAAFIFIWAFDSEPQPRVECVYPRHASTPVCGTTNP